MINTLTIQKKHKLRASDWSKVTARTTPVLVNPRESTNFLWVMCPLFLDALAS